jgi:hypothetical protein
MADRFSLVFEQRRAAGVFTGAAAAPRRVFAEMTVF